MKKLCLLSLAVASLFAVSPVRGVDFNDIEFWVGSGANQAALVIDWNDGKSIESLVWGYRWDGSATGIEMFQAVVNADSRLYAHLGTFNYGLGVFGIGYDLDGNGVFGVSATPPLSFGPGGLTIDSLATGDDNVDPAGTPTEAADHWAESWYPAPGYWGYYVKSSTGDLWAESFEGASDRVLADGGWDGFSFGNYPPPLPDEASPALVPEPGTFALFSLAAIVLTCVRRKQS